MHKELAKRLAKEIKEKVPTVNITDKEAALVTISTLHVMASFSNKGVLFNRGRLLRHAKDIVISLSTGVF